MPPQAAAEPVAAAPATGDYQRHRPEQTLLYQIVERHYPAFVEQLAKDGKQLPGHVRQAFDGYIQCGRLEHGFLRLKCDTCQAEHLLAFSCKRRGFCPSCGARRMADGSAWLVDQVLPERPIRQWVKEPLRHAARARRCLCGRLRLGLGERGLVTPNERVQTSLRPRKGPSRWVSPEKPHLARCDPRP